MAEGVVRRCDYYLPNKKRYCRMSVAKGNQYCGQHLIFANSSASDHVRKRVPCPLDPKHTVFEDALKRHVRKCNAGKAATPTCHTLNVNSGAADLDGRSCDLRPLAEYPQGVVDSLVVRVTTAYQKLKVDLVEDILEHPSMSGNLSDPTNGIAALKHLKQQSSIIGHLDKLSLLRDKTCFVEFGAGRGKLSQCIQRALPHGISKVDFVLVDRANCRRKVEGGYKTAALVGVNFHRILIDIEHLELTKMECFSELGHLVAVSKHLCGAATDFTLRCLVNYRVKCSQCSGLEGGGLPVFCALVVALCCHHRCSWDSLAGREFLASAGFTSHDCHMICHMTSWAVCGTRPRRDEDTTISDSPPRCKQPKLSRSDSDSQSTDSHSPIPIPEECDHEATHSSQGYVPHPKERIGLMCKRLIDFARLSYLRKNGLDARLVYFVDKATSLENALLICIPATNT